MAGLNIISRGTALKLAFMTFACPGWNVAQILDGAARFGFEGVELRVDSDHRHGLEVSSDQAARQAAMRQFRAAGVEVCCVATSLRLARHGRAGEQERAKALPLLDLAADLEAPGLRVFGGEPLQDESAGLAEIAREDAIKWAADNLRSLVDAAASRGVEFWFETHDYFRLGRDAAAVIRRVDHPNVRCNWDVMHPLLNGESLQDTQKLLDGLVAHTHFHDAKSADAHSICAFGEGVLPLLEMLRWLREQKFEGYLSAEYFGNALGESPEISLPRWADGCRRLLAQLGATQ